MFFPFISMNVFLVYQLITVNILYISWCIVHTTHVHLKSGPLGRPVLCIERIFQNKDWIKKEKKKT